MFWKDTYIGTSISTQSAEYSISKLKGMLAISQRRGLISLISKKNKALYFCTSYIAEDQ